MEHTERSEALNAIDVIASEIHSEYMKVAEQTGHKLASWDKIPEEAKGMCRTLARLTLSKMEKVYLEAREKIEKDVTVDVNKKLRAEYEAMVSKAAPAAVPAKSLSLDDAGKFLEVIKTKVLEALTVHADLKNGNPLEQGIDNAIRKFSESLAIDVLRENPELQSKLKENVGEALMSGLLGDKEA